jgi:hypothetical protein
MTQNPAAAERYAASPSIMSASSAAPDTSSLQFPPQVVPTCAPSNDHVMRTRAKSGFRLPTSRLNLHATPSVCPLPKS